MKRGKLRKRLILLVLAGVVAGSVWAAAGTGLTLHGKFATDQVEIKVSQKTVTDRGERDAFTDIIEPNQDVSYVPRITNEGADCYVRISMRITADGTDWDRLSEKNVLGLGEGWIKRGRYFYRKEPLKSGQKTDAFQGFHIPDDWRADGITSVSALITAEAVQSANFEPDFSAQLPWGAVSLQHVRSDDGGISREAVPVTDIAEIKCRDGYRFECATEDLFSQCSRMVPGDSYLKNLRLSNVSREDVKVYMDMSASGDGLSRKMEIRVTSDGKTVFEGSIAAACRSGGFYLMELPGKDRSNVGIEILLPRDAGNEYARMADDVVWTLRCDGESSSAPQTGDDSNLQPFVVTGLVCLMILTGLLYGRKRRKE